MKLRRLFTILFLINGIINIGCTNQKLNEVKIESKKIIKNDTKHQCQFKQTFKRHINDIKNTEITRVAEVFSFPILNRNIWYAVHFSSGTENYPTNKPFTREDLYKNFNNLFSKDYINALKNLDVDKLFSQGEYKTEKHSYNEEDLMTIYHLKTNFNEPKNTIQLSLEYEFMEDNIKYESRIMFSYEFVECKLTLNNIEISG